MSTRSDERGSGVLSTTFGLTVLVILLSFASHVLLNLWLVSSVQAVAVDAATDVALVDANTEAEMMSAQADALRTAEMGLGSYADQVTLEFRRDPASGDVVLHVRGEGFDLLPWGSPLGIGTLDREIRVPRERAQ